MKGAQSITRGILSNWTGLSLGIVISFFLSPYTVNKLGSVYFGIWALTMQFTSYFYLLDFGVRDQVIRYTAKYLARKQPQRLNTVLVTVMLTYTPIVAGALLLTGLAVWLVPGPFQIAPEYHTETRWAVLFTGLMVAQTFFFNVFLGILSGLRRYDLSNGIGMSAAIIRAILIVVMLEQGHGLVMLAATQFAVGLLFGGTCMFFAIRLLRREGMELSLKLPGRQRLRALTRRIVGYGAYSFMQTTGQKLIFASDAIIVGILMPIASVTYYAIAGSLAQYLRTILSTTPKMFIPVSSALHAQGKREDLHRLLISGAKLNILIALPIGITYAVLGGQFIGLWMGEEYAPLSAPVLAVLAVAQIFSAPHTILGSVLYGTGRPQLVAWLRVCEAVVNVLLSIILGIKFGLIGVALGTAIPHILLVLVILPRMACPKMGLKVRTYLIGAYLRPMVSALPALGLAWWMAGHVRFHGLLHFFLMVAVLVIVYTPCAFFLALSGDEREALVRKLGIRRAALGTK